MLVSARGAAEILEEMGLGREETRRLLSAGFAGPGIRTSSALLYDEERVRDLTTWPLVADGTIDELCPHGMFLGRIARSRSTDVAAGWKLHVLDRILISSRIERFGPMPFVATHSGYVASGAEILRLEADPSGKTAFELAEPGAWFDAFKQRRLLAGAGRSCLIWGWPPRYEEGRHAERRSARPSQR